MGKNRLDDRLPTWKSKMILFLPEDKYNMQVEACPGQSSSPWGTGLFEITLVSQIDGIPKQPIWLISGELTHVDQTRLSRTGKMQFKVESTEEPICYINDLASVQSRMGLVRSVLSEFFKFD